MNSEESAAAGGGGATVVCAATDQRIEAIFAGTQGEPMMTKLKERVKAYRAESGLATPPELEKEVVLNLNKSPLPTPCDPVRAISVDELRARFKTLPAFPKALQKVLELLRRSDVQINHIARAVEADSALALRVLRTANSPFYGSQGGVTGVRDACRVLGMKTVRNVAMATMALQQFPVTVDGALSRRELWRHGIAVGAAARALARHAKCDGETAFTAGLLHDIGRLALEACFPQVYPQALHHQQANGLLLRDAERLVFGLDHCAAGAELARVWQLPQAITDAVAGHHPGEYSGRTEFGDLVHIADVLCKALGQGSSGELRVDVLAAPALVRLSITVEQLGEWLPEIDAQVDAVLAEFAAADG